MRQLQSSVMIMGIFLAVAGMAAGSRNASAETVEEFYKGKTITLIVSTGAGGGYDIYARLVAKHMQRFLPGNPTFVVKNMPGAGHAVAAQYLYTVAPQDGTAIGTIGQNLPMAQVLDPGKMKFDSAKLNWIGTPDDSNNVTVSMTASGVTTIKDVFAKELIIGAQGLNSTSAQYALAMNSMLHTKFKIISGFTGTQSIGLAMEQGDVNGMGSNSWVTWKAEKPGWIKDKKISVLVQIGAHREKDLPQVPLLTELAQNEAQRQVFDLLSSGTVIGRPIAAPPNVPEDRVAALRAAFDASVKDPEFHADAEKAGLEVSPASGAELQAYVEKVVSVSPDVVKLLKAALLDEGVFDCKKLVSQASLCDAGDGKTN
jgi:tripartite-type tricarboxylate transporter receptor subunit TctC